MMIKNEQIAWTVIANLWAMTVAVYLATGVVNWAVPIFFTVLATSLHMAFATKKFLARIKK